MKALGLMSRRIGCLLVGIIASAYAEGQQQTMLNRAIQRVAESKPASDRILGGNRTTLAANPWQVALVWSGSRDNMRAQFCGGVILSNEWVLTAGHCVSKDKGTDAIEVLSGTDSLENGGVRSRVVQYIVHPDFRKPESGIEHNADIALLKIDLTGPRLTGSAIGSPVSSDSDVAVGAKILVTGWGVTERRYQPTRYLQAVEIPYVTNAICNAAKSYDGRISENMLCAGEEVGGKDPCQGDSGGPASTSLNGMRRLVGVVSWGEGCGDPDLYAVFTRASRYRDWVIQVTGNGVSW